MDLDMWLLRALLLLVWCSGFRCSDCNMTKVYFESRNFHSRLHWDEVKIPGREVHYSVKYHVYGQRSRIMTGCRNISKPFCDLSSEMMDIRSKYFVKIIADELCLGEITHFIPLEKTSLEAPKFSVITAGSSLTVTLTTPMGPQNHSVREISCWERCQDIGKSSVNYIVTLTQPESEAGKVFQNMSGLITLSHLHMNTEYCGVAVYELTHPSIKRQSEGITFCVTMPAADKPWVLVFVMPSLVAFFLLIALALFLCQQHITRKRNLPKALQIMSWKITPNFNPDPKVEITTVNLYNESPWNTIKADSALPNVLEQSKAVSKAGYAAQDYHDQDWHCHSYTNEQVAPVSDRSVESCTSYSMVVSVMAAQDREELSSCANDSGLGDCISPGFSSCTEEDLFQVLSIAESEEDLDLTEPDSTSKLMVLPVSRDTNGKLQFTGLAFQPVVSNEIPRSEIMPLVARSTPAEERTLTNLVFMDESDWKNNESRTNYKNVYLPNGVPQTSSELPCTKTLSKVPLLSDFTSNYKENWVPGILPDPSKNDRNCIVSNNQLHELSEPEGNVNDSPSELEATFLQGWMVQIQG